jgi:arsenite methyltransferase
MKDKIMTDPVSSREQKQRVLASFKAIASRYDELRFLQAIVMRMLELADLSAGERVLDVATGTGLAALVSAKIVGPAGRVVGIDLSPDMLAHANEKLAATDLQQVEFIQGDAEHLDFPDGSFNVVLCASALFFIPDMLGALQEFRRVLTPEGRLGFTSLGPSLFQPLRDVWTACLQRHGIVMGPSPINRLPDEKTCAALLSQAGFTQLDVRTEQLGYYIQDAEERWVNITAGLEGMPLQKLDSVRVEQIKMEHLAEIKGLAVPQGFWLDVPAIFAFGRRD